MPLYEMKNKEIKQIKEIPFPLERDIQNLVEENISMLLGLEFIRSEFVISGSVQQFRIDTLAFDEKNHAFVIIEYKQDKNFSVIDQGMGYLSAMLNNKADFVLEYQECTKKPLRKADVDWSQSRVYFISQAFTAYQKEALNFRDLPINIWEIHRFSNASISFEEICKTNATESIKTISSPQSEITEVTKVTKVYTEEELLTGKRVEENIYSTYMQFRERLVNLGDVSVKANKYYVSFKVNGAIFVDITIQRSSLKITFNLAKGELDDPYRLTRDMSTTGHLGNGDYELQVENIEKIDYIETLMKQAYTSKL